MNPTLLTTVLLFPIIQVVAQPIDIETATAKKLISVKAVVNTKSTHGYAQNTHSGDCIELHVKNIASSYQEIQLQPGQFFNPSDTSMQRMLCTTKKIFHLKPGQETSMLITAFCSQAGKSAPSLETTFKIKHKAADKLLQLAQFINEKNYKSAYAQQAVWIVSDNQPVNYLQNNDPEAKDLYDYLTVKLGIKPLPPSQLKNSLLSDWVRKIDINMEYELESTYRMKVLVVNEKDEILKMIVDNETQKPGLYKYHTTVVTTVPPQDTMARYCIVRYYRNDKLVNESRYKLKRLD